jgi:hypothetical protein
LFLKHTRWHAGILGMRKGLILYAVQILMLETHVARVGMQGSWAC